MLNPLSRLRTALRALRSIPSQLSTLQTLVAHTIDRQREITDLLRELTVRQTGSLPITPPTPPFDPSTRPDVSAADSSPRPLTSATPPPPQPPRLLTDADVVVASRAHQFELQQAERLTRAQDARNNTRIV